MQYGMTPFLMWNILAPDLRAELERRYGKEDAARVMKAAYPHFRQIVAGIEDPQQGRRYFWSLLRAGMLAAIYLATKILDDDIAPSPAECAALFADVVRRNGACQRLARRMRDDFTPMGQRRIQRDALMTQMRTKDYGWNYVYSTGPAPGTYMVTYRRCGILRLYKELGVPELMGAACRFPDVWCELEGVELGRTMCLAEGDPCCDFQLRIIPDEKEEKKAPEGQKEPEGTEGETAS